jgi:hypothetical protein
MDICLEIVKRDDAMFKKIKDDFIQIEYANGSFIEIINANNYYQLVLHMSDVSDTQITDDAELIGTKLISNFEFTTTLLAYLDDYVKDNENVIYEEKNNGATYDCHPSFIETSDDIILAVMVEK